MNHVQVKKEGKIWIATYHDSIGQLGLPVYGGTRDDAVFKLGYAVARHGSRYVRDLAEYMPVYHAELEAATAK